MSRVIIDQVPVGSQVGIDLHVWQSGKNFRGIRDITSGIHCLHITIEGIATTKYAVWLDASSDTLRAYKWDKTKESLVGVVVPNIEVGRESSDIFLLAFPAETNLDWQHNTQHLSSNVVKSIVSFGSVVVSTTSSNTDQSAKDVQDLKTTTRFEDEVEFKFVPIDLKRSWKPGAIGREITEMALDKSWLLQDTLQRTGGQDSFLGQFEFCFLSVLLFTSITSFEQWNTMLTLVCSSKQAILQLQQFYSTFLVLLEAQMKQVSIELYMDIFSLTLPRNVGMLKNNMQELSEDDAGVLDRGLEDNLEVLLDHLAREFGGEEDHAQLQAIYPSDEPGYEGRASRDDDDDDEAPVVVEL